MHVSRLHKLERQKLEGIAPIPPTHSTSPSPSSHSCHPGPRGSLSIVYSMLMLSSRCLECPPILCPSHLWMPALFSRLHHFWQVVALCAKSLQALLTLWEPMDCNLPTSSLHGTLQARILEWGAISSSRGSFWPRNRTCISCIVSCIAGRFFTTSATWEAPDSSYLITTLFFYLIIFLCVYLLFGIRN